MASQPPITVLAPAKVNLALAVGPLDPDGLHPICSWMVTVDLHDELQVTRLPGDRLSRYAILWHEDAKRRSEIDWPITSDLAVRAHLALEESVGHRLPVQLKLEKRIPVGGGLGGGSSDAAAMLRAVNQLFELDLSPRELMEIAATLGSDVPFLVEGGSAIVEGRGEEVTPHDDLPELHAVIAFPDAACATGAVYGHFDRLPRLEFRAELVRELAAARPTQLDGEDLFNDLTEPALRVAPSLEAALGRLSELAERPACLSGSGAAIFVLCDDPMHAEAVAEASESQLDLPSVAVRAAEVLNPS